jgi:hypothetical protein
MSRCDFYRGLPRRSIRRSPPARCSCGISKSGFGIENKSSEILVQRWIVLIDASSVSKGEHPETCRSLRSGRGVAAAVSSSVELRVDPGANAEAVRQNFLTSSMTCSATRQMHRQTRDRSPDVACGARLPRKRSAAAAGRPSAGRCVDPPRSGTDLPGVAGLHNQRPPGPIADHDRSGRRRKNIRPW